MAVDISDIMEIIRKQDAWRHDTCINLIASENTQSPACREAHNSDFMARYAEGHPNEKDSVNRYYQGTKYIDQIEIMAKKEVLQLFKCRQADVRPIPEQFNSAIALAYLRAETV
jgi:glycine hydroxymethyltransferase